LLSKSAISYLRETALNIDKPNSKGLIYLACMYGYQKGYNEMMKILDLAIKTDEEAREEFQESRKLLTLLSACASDRTRLEKLGKKIGLVFPATKSSFCSSLENIDIVGRTTYIHWIAVGRPRTSYGEECFIIKIFAHDEVMGRKVDAFYHKVNDASNITIIAEQDNPIDIEELFNRINPNFFLICLAEELN